jgi:hypothetical protein
MPGIKEDITAVRAIKSQPSKQNTNPRCGGVFGFLLFSPSFEQLCQTSRAGYQYCPNN